MQKRDSMVLLQGPGNGRATGSPARAGGGVHDAVLLLVCSLRVRNRHLNLHAGRDVDRRELAHDLGRAEQVDDALVDAHLEAVPRVGTLAARRLAVVWRST